MDLSCFPFSVLSMLRATKNEIERTFIFSKIQRDYVKNNRVLSRMCFSPAQSVSKKH